MQHVEVSVCSVSQDSNFSNYMDEFKGSDGNPQCNNMRCSRYHFTNFACNTYKCQRVFCEPGLKFFKLCGWI